jgi:hypothetical protein
MTRSLQLLRTLTGSRALLAAPTGAGGSAAVSASLASSALPALSAASRGLRSSAVSQGVGSHMSDNDPVVLELEKRRNLSGQPLPGGGGVPGAEGWNEALASDSEAVVRPFTAASLAVSFRHPRSVASLPSLGALTRALIVLVPGQGGQVGRGEYGEAHPVHHQARARAEWGRVRG